VLSCDPHASPCTTYLTRHPRVLCGRGLSHAQLTPAHQRERVSSKVLHRWVRHPPVHVHCHICLCILRLAAACERLAADSADAKKTLFWLITMEHHDREETDTTTTVYHGEMLDHGRIILRLCAGLIERRTDSPFSNYFCQCL
jgi:hypothetical protein